MKSPFLFVKKTSLDKIKNNVNSMKDIIYIDTVSKNDCTPRRCVMQHLCHCYPD